MYKIISKKTIQHQKSFCSLSSVQNVVRDTMKTYNNTSRFDNFCQNLYKVYLFERSQTERLEKLKTNSLNACLTSQEPLLYILKQFAINNKFGFNQDLIVQTLYFLSKTHKSFGLYHYSKTDYTIKQVHNSWRFQDLIQDIQYGLKNASFSYQNLKVCLKSLSDIEYKNQSLQMNCFKRIFHDLQGTQEINLDLTNLQNNYQLHKPYYYDTVDTKNVLKNDNFINNLNLILEDYQTTISQGNQTNEIQASINAILEEIRLNQKNVALIARSILNLREQYCKLVENQSLVLQNPNINIEMLEIEEILVQLGLLNVDELRNINLLKEKNYTEVQVTQIVKEFLHGNNEELGVYLEKLMKFNVNDQTKHKNVSFKLKDNIDFDSISDCLLYLSQIATKRVSETNEENYISDEWKNQLKVKSTNQELIQQDLLEEKNPDYMKNRDEKILDYVNCDLYYLNIYQESVQQFKDLAKVLDFQQFSVQSKFKLVLAYLNLGLGQEATKIWSQVKDLTSSFEEPSDLINLIKIFNKSNFQVPEKFKNYIFERIQKNYQEEFQISDLLEITIFLISFKESDKLIQDILKLVELNSQNIQGDSEFLEHLLDIGLYLQSKGLENFQFCGLKYLENNMKPKKIDPLREKLVGLLKVQNSQLVDFHLQGLPLSFQPDITVASIENGKISKKGFFFLDSENYSQNMVNNRIRNRFDLIQKTTGFYCEAVCTSHFLEYNDGKIKFINTQKLTDLFKKLQKQSNFQSIYIILQSLSSTFDSLSIDLIRLKLSQFLKLEDEINLQIETLALGNLEQMKYLLFQVLNIYKELPQNIIDKIYRDFDKIIKESLSLLQQQTGSLTNTDVTNQHQWIGLRLSTDLLNSKQQEQINDTFQFIDYQFWTDSNYHQYESWKNVMQKNLGVSNLSFIKSQQNQITKIIPPAKGSRSIYRPLSYPWNWESIYFEKINSDKKQNVEQLVIQESSNMDELTRFMSNLQNFKFELKMQRDHNKVSSMLIDFDFIEELISTHLGNVDNQQSKSVKYIQRDVNDYYLFKENNNQTDLYCQDLLNFIVENIQKKDKIIQILKAKQKLKQVFKEYKQGKVTKQFYNNLEKKIESNLLKALQEFNIQNEQENSLFQGQCNSILINLLAPKFLNIKYDVQQLLKDKQITQYSRFFDDDFIQQEGDQNKILDVKRFKAEQKIIKLRILKKLQQDSVLSTNEQKYANMWQNNQLKTYQFTQRDIKSLNQNDKNILKTLELSDITQFHDYSLNDFIFEFSLFFSSDLINQVELQLKKKSLPGINIDFLTNNKNSNLSNLLIVQLENNSWKKGQILQPAEIEDLNSILNILKDKTTEDKNNLKQELELRKSAFEEINKSDKRLELLEKWIEAREKQQKNPNSQRDKVEQEKQFTGIWHLLFKSEYDGTSSHQLSEFVEEFVQRLFLLEKKKFIGFDYFISKLFTHKNLTEQSNQTLSTMLQIIDLECHLDSQDIVTMCINQQSQPTSKEHLKDQIRQVNNPRASDLSIKLMKYA